MGFKIVRLTWTDASSIDDWKLLKDLPDDAFPCYSVGFLVKTTKQYYYLSNTHTKDDSEAEILASGTIMIPRKWVQSYEVLQEE